MKSCPACNNTYDDSNIFCPVDGSTLRLPTDSDTLIGSVIADRYLVTGKLGEGGMGAVYLAQHVRLPQHVAIKVLHRALTFESDMIARFNREALNASSISNAHVARVYDFGETNGMVYLAMEYVPGETLGAILKRNGALSLEQSAEIVRQIADGLDAAHKLGIVHRDLKPDNIIIAAETDGALQVKVVDFGIAKAMHGRSQSVTETGLAIGTAEFMSPEQIAGKVVDRRTDVYALGLVTFMMITGKLPFQGETKELSMMLRLTEAPRSLAEIRPDVAWPRGLQAVLSRALARDLNDRFESAGEFSRALSAALLAPPAVAADDANRVAAGGSGTARGWGRRRIVALAATAAVAVAGTWIAVSSGRDPKPTSQVASLVNTTPESTRSAAESVSALSGGTSDAGGGALTPPTPGRKTGGTGVAGAATDPPGTGGGAASGTGTVARGSDVPPPLDAQVRQTLENIEFNVDVQHITRESAQQAIQDVGDVLPRLRTRRDSSRVETQRIEAHIFLDQKSQACRYIDDLIPRAHSDDLRALQRYKDGVCR